MSIEKKPKLRNVRVEYIKGKYSFKQRNNGLNPDLFKIEFAGPVSIFIKDPGSILTLYDLERSKGRLTQESRMALKGLQMNLSNESILKNRGVTHILIYEVL